MKLICAALLSLTTSAALALPGLPTLSGGFIGKKALDGVTKRSDCVDLSGNWAGQCTVTQDGKDSSMDLELAIAQLGCEAVNLGDDEILQIPGTNSTTSSGSLFTETSSVLTSWSDDKQTLRMLATSQGMVNNDSNTVAQGKGLQELSLADQNLIVTGSFTSEMSGGEKTKISLKCSLDKKEESEEK